MHGDARSSERGGWRQEKRADRAHPDCGERTESRADVEAVALRLATLGHAAFRIFHTLPSVEAPEPAAATTNAETPFGYVRPERAKTEANASFIAGRLRAAGLRAEVLIDRAQSPADTILALARQDAADLVVLMPAVGTAPAR